MGPTLGVKCQYGRNAVNGSPFSGNAERGDVGGSATGGIARSCGNGGNGGIANANEGNGGLVERTAMEVLQTAGMVEM